MSCLVKWQPSSAARVFSAPCRSANLPVQSLKDVLRFRIMQLSVQDVKSKSFEKFYPADYAYGQEKGGSITAGGISLTIRSEFDAKATVISEGITVR
jgi:hypothetical protein